MLAVVTLSPPVTAELAPLLLLRGLAEIQLASGGVNEEQTLVLGAALRGGCPALRSLDIRGGWRGTAPTGEGAKAILQALCEPGGARLRCFRWCGVDLRAPPFIWHHYRAVRQRSSCSLEKNSQLQRRSGNKD